MSRFLCASAFLLGAIVIIWMGSAFIGSDILGFSVIVIIGAVYSIGFVELLQFRQATLTLTNALDQLSQDEGEKLKTLDPWLDKLHPSLQNSVRLRIEGERVGLPAPVITPYLVGLLVMLGLLGTFLGMVDTLQGAVAALEGTTELQAIRAGLAAPIRGLGLAFGTSVGGVAASAMLGLISTLSRRDRMLATRQLDSKISGVFRDFSLIHNRQQTYQALQQQAHALPEVAERLHALATQMESMGDKLGANLMANQQRFHESVTQSYSALAASVGNSLKESSAENGRVALESGRLAGEGIKPIVKDLMAEISSETQKTHQQLSRTAEEQLESLCERFSDTSEQVSKAWQSGLSSHEQSNAVLINNMSTSFDAFSGKFEGLTASLLETLDESASFALERQQCADKERLALWAESFAQAQERASTQLVDSSALFSGELKQVAELQQSSFKILTQNLESISAALTIQWQQAAEQSLEQQQKVSSALQNSTQDMIDSTGATSREMFGEISRLLKSSEALIQTRIDSEANWLSGHGERMDELASTLRSELTLLRDEEKLRGQAAIERLAGLETAAATHLASLGKELEEPMIRLIQTASETPRAAAEVIGHLRREISNNIERDNGLLEERSHIMDQLNTLSNSLQQATSGQREAIEMLVNSSATMLKDIGGQFSGHVESQSSKLSSIAENLAGKAAEIADDFAGSAIEMSSLGDAFTLAVQLFSDSNGSLIENLNRIEESLDKSSSRSDEQLGYYIAQAREIIDHSVISQKEIFDELRQAGHQGDLIASAAMEETN